MSQGSRPDACLQEILRETVESHFLDELDDAEEIAVVLLVVCKGYGELNTRQRGTFLHSAVPAMKACVGERRIARVLDCLTV